MNVFTVFGRCSELRTSIEIEAFLLLTGDGLLSSDGLADRSSDPSFDFLGILSDLLLEGEDSFESLSLLEWLDLSLSLCSRCLSLELLLLLELLEDLEDEELL